MPWAVWAVAGLLVVMAIPKVGYWIAYFTVIFTFLATYSLPRLIASLFTSTTEEMNGPIAVAHVGGAPLTGQAYLWELFGWTGVVWLATVAGLCLWIAVKFRMGWRARGLVNFLVLLVGWPACFWLALHILATAARE
jgi:hypothetical protein